MPVLSDSRPFMELYHGAARQAVEAEHPAHLLM
jgi:hypothetical protein